MFICKSCVLPESFPGIKFNEEGICNYCLTKGRKEEDLRQIKDKYRQRFLSLLEEVRGRNGNGYQVVLAYSGGKDSTFTLKLLREEFGMKVLAVTFDHGFLSGQAAENIRTVAEALGVDHLNFSPGRPALNRAFFRSISTDIYPLKALERASSICNTCMNLAKSFMLKTAFEMRIPLISYGWSPGQIPIQSSVMKMNLSFIKKTESIIKGYFEKLGAAEFNPIFLDEGQFERIPSSPGSPEIFSINPLAFWQYNEGQIEEEIRKLGWKSPRDTDSNSTNCLLNGFANQVHREKYGFHPYAFEIAGLVRENCMTREEGLAKLETPGDEKVINFVKEKLGVKE